MSVLEATQDIQSEKWGDSVQVLQCPTQAKIGLEWATRRVLCAAIDYLY